MTDADLSAVLNATSFDDERTFQTVIAVTRYAGGRASEIRLYPVDLGYGEPLTRSGVPHFASAKVARAISSGCSGSRSPSAPRSRSRPASA